MEDTEPGEVELIEPHQRRPGPATPGMTREEAVATGNLWAGIVRTGPGATSGWHHHGECESTIYVVSGVMRMESGPGGARVGEGCPGDFFYIPKGAIHRESNPTDSEATAVVVRSGTGPSVVNVEGPEPRD